MRHVAGALPGGLRTWRRVGTVRAMQMPEDFETVTVEGNVAGGRAGDYLCVDSTGHPYPCNREVFERAHRPQVPR